MSAGKPRKADDQLDDQPDDHGGPETSGGRPAVNGVPQTISGRGQQQDQTQSAGEANAQESAEGNAFDSSPTSDETGSVPNPVERDDDDVPSGP